VSENQGIAAALIKRERRNPKGKDMLSLSFLATRTRSLHVPIENMPQLAQLTARTTSPLKVFEGLRIIVLERSSMLKFDLGATSYKSIPFSPRYARFLAGGHFLRTHEDTVS
jgi:hypothetical protein